MSIGVGIITCNRSDFFEKCHKSIKREWYDYLVVVNDGDELTELIQKLSVLVQLSQSQ